jgi:NAD(P)-dependent dehydrogenase (short-subunit alcohol dehydrogenase family)
MERAGETFRDVEGIGGEAFAFKADVSNPKEVKAMMEAAVERFDRIDVLVNCPARHPPPMFDFKDPDWEYWKRMAHVNVMGVLVCSHCAAPHLRESGGNIVNVVMTGTPGASATRSPRRPRRRSHVASMIARWRSWQRSMGSTRRRSMT